MGGTGAPDGTPAEGGVVKSDEGGVNSDGTPAGDGVVKSDERGEVEPAAGGACVAAPPQAAIATPAARTM